MQLPRHELQRLILRLGWPATEWETGPEPKMAEKWPLWGVPKWPTNGRENGWTAEKSPDLGCPAIFPATFGTPPPEKWLPAVSPAIFRRFLVPLSTHTPLIKGAEVHPLN